MLTGFNTFRLTHLPSGESLGEIFSTEMPVSYFKKRVDSKDLIFLGAMNERVNKPVILSTQDILKQLCPLKIGHASTCRIKEILTSFDWMNDRLHVMVMCNDESVYQWLTDPEYIISEEFKGFLDGSNLSFRKNMEKRNPEYNVFSRRIRNGWIMGVCR